MTTILWILVFLLYHLLMRRKVIKPLQVQAKTNSLDIRKLVEDTRFNNQEFVKRTELINHTINKNKVEAKRDIRTNKNEITKLKSQVGRLRK